MPDPYGFDHLGDTVRCIDCPEGGPIWSWPAERRDQHAQTHRPTPSPITHELRRQRELLAAPSTHTNEETKETSTMATTKRTAKAESTKTVTLDLLRQAGEPLPAKEIAKRVIASGRCTGLKGKTPEATISAMLAVGSKPGGPFKRVGKGTYTAADSATETVEAASAATDNDGHAAGEAQPRRRQTKTSTSKTS